METPDRNPFPENMDLGIMDEILDIAKQTGKRIIGLCTYRPPSAPDYMSNHYRKPIEPVTDISNRWCDQGTYLDSEDF